MTCAIKSLRKTEQYKNHWLVQLQIQANIIRNPSQSQEQSLCCDYVENQTEMAFRQADLKFQIMTTIALRPQMPRQ
jgi:hypothetical protein